MDISTGIKRLNPCLVAGFRLCYGVIYLFIFRNFCISISSSSRKYASKEVDKNEEVY